MATRPGPDLTYTHMPTTNTATKKLGLGDDMIISDECLDQSTFQTISCSASKLQNYVQQRFLGAARQEESYQRLSPLPVFLVTCVFTCKYFPLCSTCYDIVLNQTRLSVESIYLVRALAHTP